MGGDVKPGAISIAFQNISAILGPDDLASLSAQFNDAIPPAAVAQAVAGRTVRAELGHNVYQGQIKGNQVLPGRITLLTKPPLPAAGGVPVVATEAAPAAAVPVAETPAVPAPGAVAAPVVEAPAAAPVPVAETAAPAQPTVEELQAQLAALQAAGTGEAAPATAAGTPIPVADPSF
jgi:hypothetical protein